MLLFCLIYLHFFCLFHVILPPEDHVYSKSSPRRPRASLVSSASTSSFRQALSSSRATSSISPAVASADQEPYTAQSQSNTSHRTQNLHIDKSLPLDPDGFNIAHDAQEEDALDTEEVNKKTYCTVCPSTRA